MKTHWFKIFVWLILACPTINAATLHGTASEKQAISEMRSRLKTALAKNDFSACKREGDNMARYQQVANGQAVIDTDLAVVQKRIREAGTIYNQLRDIRDVNSKKAVDQAYRLIRTIATKMVEDAIKETAVTLVTAPVPGAGRIVVEMGKQADSFLGNFTSAGKVVNEARALRQLDAIAQYADSQMKSLKPAITEATSSRTKLMECQKQFQAGVAAAKTAPSKSATPINNMTNAQTEKLLSCACRCSSGCAASSGYSTQPMSASPHCKAVANGPCYCSGFGCTRKPLTTACVQSCMPAQNIGSDPITVKNWVAARNNQTGTVSLDGKRK